MCLRHRPKAIVRETLQPLKAQLEWTDGVLDQIVYRLYGLTAEEIRVVEGKA